MRLWATFLLLFPRVAAARNPPTRPLNVIIISFDALRADRLGVLGQKRPLTPNLDRLARQSYLFSNAVTQAPWTLPSMASFFTSTYPHQHQLTNKFSVFTEDRRELATLPRRMETMAEAFLDNGYRTAAFTGGGGLEGSFGFSRGFDVYFDSDTFDGFRLTFPLSLDWIRRQGQRPFFLFVHGYDVHGQYIETDKIKSRFADPHYHGPFTGSLKEFLKLRMMTIKGEPIHITQADARFWRALYDEKVLRADEKFGRFWSELKRLPGLLDRTVIVVIADHGDQYYEHGGFDHGMTLYEELVHVPLIIPVPGRPGRTIKSQVRLVDVMPTLLDLCRLRVTPRLKLQMKGRDLVPLMDGQSSPREAVSETDFLLQSFKRSLRTAEGWKLIYDLENLRAELYDLKTDPGEHHDLRREKPGRARAMTRRLFKSLGMKSPI